MAQRKADTGHIQEFQRLLHLAVHSGEPFQTALGQGFRRLLGLAEQSLGLGLVLRNFFIGSLDGFQLLLIRLTAGQQFFHFQSVPFFQAVNGIQPTIDLV